VRAVDAQSGKARWEAYTAGAIYQSPAVWEGRLYVGSADGRVYAFEAATGRRLWTFRAAPTDRWIPVCGKLHSTWPVGGGVLEPHTLPDGRRLAYAYDIRRGANTTELTMLRPLRSDEPATAKPAAKDVLWTSGGRRFTSFIIGPTSLLTAGNCETKSAIEHFVATLNLADGSDLWRHKLPAAVVKGGTAIDHAGRVFVTLDNGQVICLGAAR
jgi:outer membrane protein assembly factor BamB